MQFPTKVVDLTPYWNMCREYVEERRSRKQYKFYSTRSGQSDLATAMRQDMCGRLAEWGTKLLLGLDEDPDMDVYQVRDKSYNTDFPSYNLDVKSVSHEMAMDSRFGRSWVIQDKVKEKMIMNPSGLLALVVVALNNGRPLARIETIISFSDALEYMAPMVKGNLTDKGAIYYLDKSMKSWDEDDNRIIKVYPGVSRLDPAW